MSRRTIQSPGVEIREIDLSQRPAAALGTSVFIAGFSNQGPTDEIFNVGTFAEFEEIYGKPTNAAERYFYHSTKQVFDSDANVLVSRLPYGTGDGQSTEKYSALFYPVSSINTSTITAISNNTITLNTSDGQIGSENMSNVGAGCTFELVTQDSNGQVKYTSIDGTGTYSSGTFTLTSTTTEFATVTGDTLVSGQALSGAPVNHTVSLSADNYFVLGNPLHVELTRAQYLSAQDENFTWYDAGGTVDPGFPGRAGMIVLNKAKVATNNDFEGYYVGVTDNSVVSPASNHDIIRTIKAVTSSSSSTTFGNLTEIPSSRYEFALSSTPTSEKNSVSKTLETFSKFDIDGGEFVDTINIGLFKVRNTPFSNTDLSLTHFLAEGYTGSLNSFRKIQNENGGQKKTFFIGDVEENSPNVKVIVNPYISKHAGDWASSTGDGPKKYVRVANKIGASNAAVLEKVLGASAPTGTGKNFGGAPALVSLGAYSDVNNNSSKNTGSIPDKLDRIFNVASNVDLLPIDVSIEAGLGTVFAVGKTQGLSAYDDTAFVDVDGSGTGFYTTGDNMTGSDQISLRDNYRTIFNKFETFARQTRKDHIFVADILKPLVVQGSRGKVLDDKTKNFSQHVYWPMRHQFGFANSNFATTYGNWAKVYDGTSDNQIWIPFSGVAAKIYANNDANFAPWYAPAGFNRGIVTGVNDVAISPTQRQRDQLYRIAINPVTQFPAEGIVVFGQKTLQRKPTAFDRVNVRRLFLDLEKRTRETLKYFVFEPNTFLTRNKVVNTLTPIFENCKQTEGVYDYLIVCDSRNNPASVIDQNELRVDIYLKPVRAAEFILVNFYAVNTDVNFEEIAGQ
jgi:hypothetical protein